jgi:hypothetical protein
VSPAANLFRFGAFVALALLVRHTGRTEGTRNAAIFLTYLTGLACFRECLVWLMSRATGRPPPFSSDARLGQLGPINVLVVVGWVVTALLAFEVAKMIQRRNFPGTNLFLTLALAAVVTTAISYAVEVTGARVGLWQWGHPRLVAWLPLDWPEDAFEGWATMSYVTLGLYAAIRYGLFARTLGLSLATTALALSIFGVSVAAERWVGHAYAPWRFVVLAYLLLSVVLGFVAPPKLLGSSDAALRDPD